MRVIVANVHFPPDSYGGATVVVEDTCAQLSARGHDVCVITTTSDPNVPAGTIFSYEEAGCTVQAVRLVPQRDLHEDYWGEWQRLLFREALNLFDPDVVLAHSIQGLGVSLVEESVKSGIPTAVYVHDSWWQCVRHFMLRPEGFHCGQWRVNPDVCRTCVDDELSPPARLAASDSVLSQVNLIITPSTYWRDFLTANGVAADRLMVIPNGIRQTDRPWPARPRTPVRFGFVGGVGPGKGSYDIVEAFQGLDRSDYVLDVVDAHVNLGRATIVEDDFRVPGQLRILPGYTAATASDFFSQIDVLLAPSNVKESYGLAVREAIVHGVWPILKDVGGPNDHLTDGFNATVLPWGSGASELREAIRKVLDNPSRFVIQPEMARGLPTPQDQAIALESALAAQAGLV